MKIDALSTTPCIHDHITWTTYHTRHDRLHDKTDWELYKELCAKAKEECCVDESMFQMEVIHLQSSFALEHHLQSADSEDLWSCHVNKNQLPTVRKVALQILTMFGSTYTCESSFSHLNAIKTKARCSLTNKKLQ